MSSQDDIQPEFVPIRPNPYIYGNNIQSSAMFFGREAEFDRVHKIFESSSRGALMVFFGERRSGKTSILWQIQQGRLGSEFISILIPLQDMSDKSEAEFIERIIADIERATGDDPQAQSTPFTGSAEGFRKFVEDFVVRMPDRKLVLMFDEYEVFEDKIENGTLSKEFLYALSSLKETYPVFLIFTGSQHLEEHRKDYWSILARASEYTRISYLDPRDTARLIREPVAGRVEFSDAIVARIVHLTAGQPYYTQAICWNIVYILNQRHTSVVTEDILEAVVTRLVENPLPQMTFAWKQLSREKKLTLALLAEVLEKESDRADASQLVAAIRKGRYPLDLDRPALANTLNALFVQELLGLEQNPRPAYVFRMDLWRRWIRRMLSVWRVMRDEGLDFRRPSRMGRRRAWVVGAAAMVVVATLGLVLRSFTKGGLPPEGVVDGTGILPQGGSSRTADVVTPTAEAFSGEAPAKSVEGSLTVRARPAEGEILVDGRSVGKGTATLPVEANQEHEIEVRLEGYRSQRRRIRVEPNSTHSETVELVPVEVALSVQTEPDSTSIILDGVSRGLTPLPPIVLDQGPHRIVFQREGYVKVDTSITVGATAEPLYIKLEPEPPAVLVIKGNPPAQIFVSREQIGSGELINTKKLERKPGRYTIEILFSDGTKDEATVQLHSGQELVLVWQDGRFLNRSGE